MEAHGGPTYLALASLSLMVCTCVHAFNSLRLFFLLYRDIISSDSQGQLETALTPAQRAATIQWLVNRYFVYH